MCVCFGRAPRVVSAFPHNFPACITLVVKTLGVIAVTELVLRLGSHKTHLDNQNVYETYWLF